MEKELYNKITNMINEIIELLENSKKLEYENFTEKINDNEIIFKLRSLQVHIEDIYYIKIDVKKEMDKIKEDLEKIKIITYFINEKIYNHKQKYFFQYRRFDIKKDIEKWTEIIKKIELDEIKKLINSH